MSDGLKYIGVERLRQIEEEGWTPEHDDEHFDGSMAMAAACYASTSRLYSLRHFANGYTYDDPWPWEGKWDKRYRVGEVRNNPGNRLPDPSSYTRTERLNLLVKAGALIAAEIDRLIRAEP